MRTPLSAALLFVALQVGCGAISNFADFDSNHSTLSPSLAIAPADGNTVVTLVLALQYSGSSPAARLPVTLAVTGTPVTLAASTGMTDAKGIFRTTMTSSTPGTARIVARLQGQTNGASLTTSVQFVPVAASASLAMGLQATVDAPSPATLTILDQNGQRVLYYDGTVSFTSSDPQATLPAPYQFTTADGGQHDFNIFFATPGVQSVRVADPARSGVASEVDGINVFIKTAPMLELSMIADATAGTVNHVQVRAVDISAHTQTDYTGTVHFTSTDPNAVLPSDTTFAAADAGIKVLPVTLKTAGIQAVSAVDVNNVVISGTQANIAVLVDADRFAVAMATPVTAGVPVTARVRAVDAYGNVDPAYTGSTAFSSSDPHAALPATFTWTPADAGMRDVNVTFYTAGHQSLSVQGAGSAFVGSAAADVVGDVVRSLELSAPAQAVAGNVTTLTATARDIYGNVSTGYTGHLVLASSDTNATLGAPIDVTPAMLGSARFTQVRFAQVGIQTVTVTDANRALSANVQVAVTSGHAMAFSVGGLVTAPAGQVQAITVTARDAYGNTDINYAGTVRVTSDDPNAVLPPPVAFGLMDAGVRTLTPVTLVTAGLRRVDVTDAASANTRGSQGNVRILPVSASTLVVNAAAQAVAGVGQNVVVRAIDAYGNLDPNYTGQVTLSSSDARATLPVPYAMGPADAGSTVLPLTLYAAGTQTVTAGGGNIASVPAAINVSPAVATKLGLNGLTDGRAGRTQSLVIQALDNYNNLVPAYTGSVRLTSTDTNAVLQGTVALSSSDGGQKLTPVALLTAGVQSVTARDTGVSSIQGSQGNILVVAVADRLRVQAPATLTAGDRFNLTIAGVDAYGNVDTGYTGTVSLLTTSSNATLPATLSIDPNTQGVVTNGNVALLGVGSNLSITAQDTVRPFVGTRAGITVQPAAAARLGVASPAAIYVGLPFSATLTAYDAYGNQATGYTGGVQLTSSDPNAGLGTVTTFVAGGQGSAVAAGLLWNTASPNASLTATDVLLPGITGTQTGIVVTAGGAAKLRLSGATSGLAGHSDTVTLTALDTRNNVAVGYVGSVHFASTDPLAVLPANYAFTGADAGVHVFTVGWGTAGRQSLMAQDTGIAALSGRQNDIIITAQPATALRLTDLTAGGIVAGAARILQVAAIDGFGNVDPNYTGAVTITSSDPAATLPAPIGMGSGNGGIATVSYTLATAGTQSVTGTDAGSPALVGKLTGLVVQPGAPAALRVSGVADALAGTSNTAVIEAVDAQGNRVPGYVGTVHLGSSDPRAVLSGNITFGAPDAGRKTSQLTLFTAGDQSLTATDTQQTGISGTQSHIHVLVSRTRLSVVSAAAVTASQGFNITVAAVDAYGNLDPNYTGTVALSSSDPLAYFGAASTAGPGSPASLTFVAGDAGQKSLPGTTLYLASANASILAADNAHALSGTRPGIVVSPGAVHHVNVGAPAGVTPGIAFSMQVSAVDNANNVVPSYTGSMTLVASDPNAVVPAGISLGAADAGSIRVGNLTLLTAGPQTLTLTDANGITGHAGISVAALRPAALLVTGATSGVAGHTDSVTVAAVDAYGNPANGNIGVVTFSSTDPAAALPAAFAMGTAPTHTFTGVQFQTVGVQALRVSAMPPAGSVLVGLQGNIVITRAAASRLTFSGLQDAVAGQAQNVIIAATDAFGNADPTVSGTITLTSSDPNAVVPGPLTLSAGQASASITLKTAGARTVSASGAGLAGTSPSVAIVAAAAVRLAVTGVPNGTVGQSATATIAAYDPYNNVATGFLSRVLLTSTDPLATLPLNVTFAAGDAGSKSAALVFFTAGTQTLTAIDDSNSSITGQQSGIVIAAAGNRFSVTAPAGTGAGQAFSVTVRAIDNSNTLDPTFTGTVHLTSTDPQATLPADVVFAGGDAGVKTIAGFTLATAGTQSITASTVPSGRAGTSGAIAVGIAGIAGLSVVAPREVTAGGNFNVKIMAVDAFGNTVPSYVGSVRLSSNDPLAMLSPNVTFAGSDAGIRVVSATLRTATGSASLSAVDLGNANFAGQQNNITVLPLATPASLTLSGLTSGAAGHLNTVTVAALDAYGNRMPQYRGTVRFASSDALAVLPLRYVFTGADAGAHAFAGVVLATVGNQIVSVTDGSANANQTVAITPAGATFFVLDSNRSVTSGQTQNVTLTATDPYGNIDTNYAGTVGLSSTDPLAVLPALYTFVGLDAGQHRLALTWQSAGDQSVTATDSAGHTGTLADVVVNPGLTSRLSVSGITGADTGTATSVVVRALDAAGNVTPSYRGQVHLTSSDSRATLAADANFTVSAGGERAFGVTFATSGNQSLTATDNAVPSITGTLANIVVNAPPARLKLVLAGAATAGVPAPLTVQIMDNFNNLATGYTGTVLLSSSDAQATYGNQATFAAIDGGNKSIAGAFRTAGTQTIAVVDNQGALQSAQAAITIGPAATQHYDVGATPSSVSAGGNVALSLVARDTYGNLTPAYAGTAHITSSDATASLPADVTFAAGAATPGASRLTRAGTGTTFTATDVASPNITGTSLAVTVTPLGAATLLVAGATSGLAGHTQSVTVSARDIYNNVVPSYAGVIAMTSSDAAAALPSNYTFVGGDAGVRTFSTVVLATVGNQSLTASDTLNAGVNGTESGIVITPAGATRLVLTGPASATAGAAQTCQTSALDAYGNIDPNYRGTVTLTGTDTQASLPGPYTFQAADAGNHNASLTPATAGTQTFTVSGAGLTSGQLTMAVAPAATRRLQLTGLAGAAAGTPQTVSVRATDNYNNTTPSYRGTVGFTSTDGRAGLPGATAYLSGDAGSKTFSVTLATQGLQQVRVADTFDPNLASAQNALVTGAQTQLAVTSDTNVVAGVAFNATLRAVDVYGNINPNYTGTAHFTASDANATLPGDVHFTLGNQGVVVLNHQVTFRTAGAAQSLTATDANNGLVGTQTGIAVTPGPAAVLAVVSPNAVVAGATFTAVVTAYDAYDNVATGYAGRIAFSASDANATLPSASTLTLANQGSKSFTNGLRLTRTGAQLLTVTDANNMFTANAGVVVQSAGAYALAISGPGTVVAGTPLTLAIAAYDAFNNPATGMTDTITIGGSDLSASYPAPYAFNANDAGAHTLTNLTTLRTAGLMSVTVSDANNPGVNPASTYITVTPAPVSTIIIHAPSSVTAATNFNVTVAAVDTYVNVVNNYTATLPLLSTDAFGMPSTGVSVPVAFSNGSSAQRTLGAVRLNTAGPQQLTATDPNNGALTGFTGVLVNAGNANALAVTVSPNAVAGQATDVTVTALDAGGNLSPNFVGTVTFSATDVNATLPPSMSIASGDGGRKTAVSALTWRQVGWQTLTANSGGLGAGSANANVTAAGVVGLQIFGLGNLAAGATNQATVRAVDAYGNTAPSYAGTITWSSSDLAASLPGAAAFGSSDMGSKTANLRLFTAGAQSVTVSDTTNGFAASQNNVIVTVQASRFAVTSPNTVVAGAPLTLTVAATDAYSNLDANFTGNLHFSSTNANATFPGGVAILAGDHGQRAVGGFVLTTASPNATITVFNNSNTIVGTSNPVTVVPANANRLGVVTAVSTPAGTPLTATVTAYDTYANVATGYTGTVAVTTNNANAVLPGPSAFAGNNNGILAIGSIYLLNATQVATLTVTDTGNANIVGSQTGIQVTPLTADHFVLSGLTGGAAGHTGALNVVARDIYNNIATSYRGSVSFTSTDAAASFPTGYTYSGADQGFHTFPGVYFSTVGTQSVTARDTVAASIIGTQSNIVITGTNANHLTLTGGVTSTAGQTQNIAVAAVDAFGNVDPNFVGTVSFATTDANATVAASHAFVSADAGAYVLPVTYRIAGSQTLTASGPAAVGSAQTGTLVNPNNANSYVVFGIPSTPAGQAATASVRVIDAYNNTVPLYRGQAHFTSSDANAALPSDYTFAAADNGFKSLGLTFFSAGTQWLRATDTNTSGITGMQNGIVVGPAQSHLQVTCNTNVVAGSAFSVTVSALDSFGNLDTGYNGVVHFTSGDPNGTLPPDTTVSNANHGTFTLSGVVLRIATANQRITATDANTPSNTGAQSGIRVSPAAASVLTLTGSPNAVSGVNFSGTVTAYDAFNNVAAAYSGTVAFSSSDPNAVLPASGSFNAAAQGTRTFSNAFSLVHAGNQNITVTDAGQGLAASLNVTVGAAAATQLVLTTNAATTAGNIIVAQVQAKDAYGNIAQSYRGTVAFSSGDANASYPPVYPFSSADNGNHIFNANLILRQAGAQVVNVVDTGSVSVGAGTAFITVNPAPLSTFRLTAPASVNAGDPMVATFTGLDSYGNIANTYAGTAVLSSTDPNGTPSNSTPVNTTFASGTSVQRTLSGLQLTTSGNQTLVVRDANIPATLNGQANVTVVPRTATNFALAVAPTPVAGQAGTLTLRAYDAYANLAPTYRGTVSFASSDPNAALPPPSYSFTSGDQAVHAFSNAVTLYRAGNTSITVSDTNGLTQTFSFAVAPANANALVWTAPATTVAGAAFTTTLTAYDRWGNLATGYRGNLTFSSSDPSPTLPSIYTFSSADNGAHVFNGNTILRTAGSRTLVATDSNAAAYVVPATTSVTVNANTVAGLSLSGYATAWVAGTNGNITVTARDAYGNIASGYTGTVQFTSSDVYATLPVNRTFSAGDHSAVVVAPRLNAISMGSTITATDISQPAMTATTTALRVDPAPAPGTPAGTVGLTANVLHRGTEQLYPTYLSLSDGLNAASFFYAHTPTYSFTNSHFSSTLNMSYSSGDGTAFNTFLGADAAGTAASDSAGLQTTYLDYSGYVHVTTGGNYTFSATADDIVLVWMGGADTPGAPTMTMASGWNGSTLANYLGNFSDPLTVHYPSAGYYAIELFYLNQYYGSGGNGALSFTISGPGSISLFTGPALSNQQSFTQAYDLNTTSPASYNYDASKVSMGRTSTYLTPMYTRSGDSNAATFAGGTGNSVAWDSGGFARLSTSGATGPYTFYSGFEPFDTQPTWRNTLDAVKGSSNVTGYCCGLTTPEGFIGGTAYSGANGLLFSGYGSGGGTTYAYEKLFNLQNINLQMDASSYFSFWIFPEASSDPSGYNISGSNSLYVTLDVIFTDGTHTAGLGVTDANGIGMSPTAQGGGGKVVLSKWNYVRANLGSLAGKTVDRIDFVFQKNGATGGFRGFFDDIFLSGTTTAPRTNVASLDASWAPAWSNLVAYWPMDGTGTIANNATVAAASGTPNLVAKNANGGGMVYANGVSGQSIYMDGVDDYLNIPSSGFPNSSAMSFSIWHRAFTNSSICERVFEFGTANARYGLYPNCNSTYTIFQQVFYNPGYASTNTTPSVALQTTGWTHYVTTVDASNNAKLYVNGNLYGQATFPQPLSAVSSPNAFIGASMANFDFFARGFFDEAAVWNVALSQNQVESIYQRQSAAYSGTFTSKVFPTPFLGAAATGLGWTSTLPYGKPLPSGGLSETMAAYPNLASNVLNANLITLWHFDEAALGTVTGGDFYDDSGSGNPGTAYSTGTLPVPNQSGIFNRSVHVFAQSITNKVVGPVGIAAPNTMTLSAWFHKAQPTSGLLAGLGSSGGSAQSTTVDRAIYINTSGQMVFDVYSGSIKTITSPLTYTDGRWHHAAATLSSAGTMLYIDGLLVASDPTVTSGQSYTAYLHAGCDDISSLPGVSDLCFAGDIDEVALWTRALSATEINQLWRRGANRAKYQVKICQNSDCSDIASWSGPDATSGTWFSEAYNIPGLSAVPGAPNLPFATVAPALAVNPNKPYVQYRMALETDDMNSLCSYSGSAPCSPEINTSQFFRINYDASSPAVVNNTGIPYYALQSVAGTLGAAGCPAGVTYMLSPDGVTNYYYNGLTWTASNGTLAQSNTQGQLTQNAINSFSTQFPFGQTYFQALLSSNGVLPCTLAKVTWTGTH